MLKSKLSYLWGFAILLMFFGLPNAVRAFAIECGKGYRIEFSYKNPDQTKIKELPDALSEQYYMTSKKVDLNNVSPKKGDRVNGYQFDGWEFKSVKYDGCRGNGGYNYNQAIDIVDDKFELPEWKDSDDGTMIITLEGSWTKLYNLNYQFDGDQPEGYKLPENGEYVEGEKVTLDDLEVGTEIGGYRFLGWKMNGNEMKDNSFEMPGSDVTITAVWSKLYDVKYKIEGEVPEGYELPENGQYIQGENVSMGSLKTGDVIGEYRFLGWKIKDGKTVDANFEMPAGNIELIGSFEKIEAKENADNPKTFDNIMFYGTLLLVSIGIIGVLYHKIIKN